MSSATDQAAAEQAAAAAAFRQFTIEAWTLYAFGVLVTVLRTYARITAVGIKKLRADDYLVWVGIVSTLPKSISRAMITNGNRCS